MLFNLYAVISYLKKILDLLCLILRVETVGEGGYALFYYFLLEYRMLGLMS